MTAGKKKEIREFFKQLQMPEGKKERKKELLRAVSSAVQNELTERQKECIVLFYGQNFSVQETAKILSICPSTVSRHLKKARNRIKRVLQYGYFPVWEEE